MKKLLFVLLLSISSVVQAQWTLITDIDDTKFFIDLTSIQQIGQYKRGWLKTEYSSNSEMQLKHKIRSSRALAEFDCREKKYRNLSFQTFKQPNLIDSDLTNNKQDEWKFIAPGTIADSELIIICKK
jgi:hypothetical protein